MRLHGRVRAMAVGLLVVALGSATTLAAQQVGIVQGTVVDATTGSPLAAVNVTASGSNARATTDAAGTYTLRGVPAGSRTVSASRVGYGTGTQTVAVTAGGTATANFRLTQSATELEGLVVTALGITREERAVSQAVQSVSGEELNVARETNVVNALQGKVSGVTITNAGPQGGSARVVIRGASSIAGNNQPLFVVDGVPIDNAAPRIGGYGGVDYGNAAGDINPDIIQSVTVLKGPNAAALYGSRAANGAIVITTKKGGRAGTSSLTVSQNLSFEDPLRLPSYQNQYGQGFDGKFEYVDGAGGGVADGVDESWGPRCDGTVRKQFFGEGPFNCYPNNVRDFFETGLTSNTNVQFSGATDRSSALISVSHLNQEGMYPGMELARTTVALNGATNFTDKLQASGSVQYINGDGNNRPGVGYEGDNPMLQFVWFGRSVDTNLLRQRRRDEFGNHFNWNYNYHSNPYWIALENENFDERDRLIGNIQGTYNFNDWLSATARTGTDVYQDQRTRTFAGGTIGIGLVNGSVGPNGAFDQWDVFFQETNSDVLLRATPEFGENFSLDASLGANRRDQQRRSEFTEVLNLSAPNVFSLANRAEDPYIDEFRSEKRVNSLYGQATLGFRDYLFLDVTGRNDWSSTLPDDNNSYFYPSVSGSVIFTDALPQLDMNGLLSFGKLRASWARVGNDADPYLLRSTYVSGDPFGGVPTFGVNNVIANANLKPEQTESVELGAELRFLGDRLGLDFTWYNQSTTNQILTAPISATSGYTAQVVNAGEITNQGIELQATAIPVRLDNGFEWNVTANFAKNDNEVKDLYGDIQTVVLGTYWSLTSEARKGEPYGALYGFGYQRSPDGQIVVSSTTGRPLRTAGKQVLGHYTPDWIGSLRNEFSFRGVGLSFLVDTRQGGELFSVTNMFGRYAGILEETVEGRDGNWIVPNTVKRVITGSDTTYVPNDIPTNAQAYNQGLYGLHEAHVFDASFIKLRELVLGYTVPETYTRRWGLSALNVALVGRNLALWTDAPHLDPETAFDASNAQGFEFGQFPTARSWGINVSVTPNF